MNKNVKIALGVLTGAVVMTAFYLYAKRWRLNAFKSRVVSNSIREWELWGKPLYDHGKRVEHGAVECSSIYKDRVGEYWKKGANRNLDGCDQGTPWSSAFISFIIKKSGAGKNFVYSSGHSNYIRDSIKRRKAGQTKGAFIGYRLDEKPVELSDLVCYSRQSGITYDTTYNYKSHCDVVVKVNKRKREVEVIGGNVSDGVTKKIIKIDKDGYLTDTNNKWFAILKNKF